MKQVFLKTVEESIFMFETSLFFKSLLEKKFNLDNYHKCLISIFHQVYNSSATFALSAVNCPHNYQEIREYLFHHAEEEKTHWKWILNDLERSGYKGELPTKNLPPKSTSIYIAYNYFIAMKHPIARLGIALTLEGIGAKYGKKCSELISSQLGLSKDQVSFGNGHSDTDVGHIKDIQDILFASDLTKEDWNILVQAAKITGVLYKNIYDEALEK